MHLHNRDKVTSVQLRWNNKRSIDNIIGKVHDCKSQLGSTQELETKNVLVLRKTLAYVPCAAMCIKITVNFVRDHLELDGRQSVVVSVFSRKEKKTIDEGHNESDTCEF